MTEVVFNDIMKQLRELQEKGEILEINFKSESKEIDPVDGWRVFESTGKKEVSFTW